MGFSSIDSKTKTSTEVIYVKIFKTYFSSLSLPCDCCCIKILKRYFNSLQKGYLLINTFWMHNLMTINY